MPSETFHSLIARNKRNSVLLVLFFLLIFAGLALLIGYVWTNDLTGSLVVAGIAAVVAFLLAMASYFGGSSVLLGISGAHEIAKADDPQLFNVVEELALAGGLPMPRIYVIRDRAMNAFATGRNPKHATVAITTGLRERLSRDELQGVMAHEMSHVRHYDVLFATMVAVMVGVLAMLAYVFRRSLWFGGMSGSRHSRGRGGRGGQGGGGQILLLVIAIVLSILAPILAKIVQMAISRQREYLADAGAIELTRNPQGLAGALAKLTGDPEVLQSANPATAPLYIVNPLRKARPRSASLFSTHPELGDRIKRIMSLQG